MGKLPAIFTGCALPRFRFRFRVRVRVPLPSPHYKTQSFLTLDDKPTEFSCKSSCEISFNGDDDAVSGQQADQLSDSNRVMVVVDSTPEAKAALQWALSHTVQTQDTILLLLISSKTSNPPHGANSTLSNHKAYELLDSMKNACEIKKPGVQVEIALRYGKEKAAIIVEEARQRSVSLLVLGQKRRSIMWRLQKMWTGKRTRVVDYCIQNANCLTIAVRRKSTRHGGYLITTKRHKSFWLLA